MEYLEELKSYLLNKNHKDALLLVCDLLCGLTLGGSEITNFSIMAADGTLITINSVPKSQSYVDEYGVLHEG